MTWKVELHRKLDRELKGWPVELVARFVHLLEVVEQHGPHLGLPHSKALGHGLYELRFTHDGILGRAIFGFGKRRAVIVLVVFIKKTQKTPLNQLRLAKRRLAEVLHDDGD